LQVLERCRRKFELDLVADFALRSPSEKIGGLFYFGRMLDKIRLHAKGRLPADYHANLGKGFDEKCVRFLRINYDPLIERVKKGGTDEEILKWCFNVGRKPSDDDIYVWNEFMRKRGWNDEVSEILSRRKQEAGMADRSDIETSFQFIDADEGRLP
jgi:gluconokinase